MKSENQIADWKQTLDHVGACMSALLEGLSTVNDDDRQKVLEYCGTGCATAYGALESAKQIANEATEIQDLVSRVNQEIPWCGKWVYREGTIEAECIACGCPLVRKGIVNLTRTLCLCSRGFVKSVFEMVLNRSLRVELPQAIGFGDKICKFVVYLDNE